MFFRAVNRVDFYILLSHKMLKYAFLTKETLLKTKYQMFCIKLCKRYCVLFLYDYFFIQKPMLTNLKKKVRNRPCLMYNLHIVLSVR